MTLNSLYSAVRPGVPAQFQGSGGTGPYAYSIQKNSSGGSINSSTGIYTAGNSFGTDTVKVVDSLGAIATSKIKVVGPLHIVADILASQLGLAVDQATLYNQKIDIPNDQRLYVVVGVLSEKVFANRSKFDPDTQTMQQVANVQATLSIDIFSRGTDARDRKEEVVLALMSPYSQGQQELNGMHIARVPSGFVNLSQVEGPAVLYRFNLSVNVLYAVTKAPATQYFDSFDDAEIAQDEA